MKICFLISTRPEIIRLSKIIERAKLIHDVTVIWTNQNFDASLSTQFFEEFNIKPDITLINKDKLSGNDFIGSAFIQLHLVFNKHISPDAVLMLGDTNGAFVAASVAKRLNIPIFHMEAFNRCWDIKNTPEEVNRRQIDAISDYHLCYTQQSKQNGISEGYHPKNIFVVGNPIAEVINYTPVEQKEYYLSTIHRKENLKNMGRLSSILFELNNLNKKVKLSAHPSLMNKLKDYHLPDYTNIEFFSPCNHSTFLKMQKESVCTISDSGSNQEQSYLLNKPSVLLRLSTERPEIIEYGGVVHISDPNDITDAIKTSVMTNKRTRNINNDYHEEVSNNVMNILMRYNIK